MKFKIMLMSLAFVASNLLANEFVDYDALTKQLKAEATKKGNYATEAEVKAAIESKDWLVADVRTMEEWAAAHIKGTVRIGRQAPENALALHALDAQDNFVKQNLIVICNSAARASIEAETFRKMGFKTVKIYDLYSWIDSCNPVVTNYSVKNHKPGTGLKFGAFYAEHCSKK
ncbi:MAG: rhodanese-like domain-containing protein [Arcobacteraceae bacterium]